MHFKTSISNIFIIYNRVLKSSFKTIPNSHLKLKIMIRNKFIYYQTCVYKHDLRAIPKKTLQAIVIMIIITLKFINSYSVPYKTLPF